MKGEVKKDMDKDMVFRGAKKLGFGLMRLPLLADQEGVIDIEQAKLMVDSFLEQGFTYFDTAWMYCNFKSEEAVKILLAARHPRESYTLATKLHAGFLKTEEDRDRIFNEQLRKTGVSFFDYYLMHDINSHSIRTFEKLHVFEWLREKKASGLAKHIGFSFHDTPELLDRILTDHPEMEFVQIQLNYLDYENPGIRSRECYETAVRHGVPVIVMEPVKGGTLVNVPDEAAALFKAAHPDWSIASWAIRFAASHENVRIVLSGMSTEDQLADNTGYMKAFRPLEESDRAVIGQVTEILNRQNAIPCTGCSYCTDGCPKGIPIPKYFSLYNAEMKEQEARKPGWTPQSEYYENLTTRFAKASDCIGCGQCEGICPQHLPVISHLKAVAERFED